VSVLDRPPQLRRGVVELAERLQDLLRGHRHNGP
jgi:hypothetical protein